MRLPVIADRIGARIVLAGENPRAEIRRVVSSDRMSDLLAQADEQTLLLTRLSNTHLGRIAGLMDAPAICLVDGVEPSGELLGAAVELGIGLIVSPADLAETGRRLRDCLPVQEGQA